MNQPMRREDYYKVHMDKGIDKSYDSLIQCDTFTGVPFDEIFAWLHHYEYEFNESPYLQINRCMKLLQKESGSFDWA